jgi:nitrogen fixation protein NifU and related proteins
MSDLRQLYQQIILDHNKNPRNFRANDHAQHRADGNNPLCGDRVTLYVNLDGDHIAEICFQGSGCAISKASASLMTEILMGKSVEEAEAMFEAFNTMVSQPDSDAEFNEMGSLAVFSGLRQFPARIKCATLPWFAMLAALHNQQDPITTEGDAS